MKYLFPVLLILTLPGCEKNSLEPQNITDMLPADVSVDTKTQHYLDQPLQAKTQRTGLYRLVRSGQLVENPETSTGKALASPVIQLVKKTDRIPLIKGARMYLQYRIWYLPDQPAYIDLRRVLIHPEIQLPDGSVSTGSDFMIKRKVSVNQAIGYTGYGLDEDYELVEGDWVFQLWHEGRKLVEQTFTTYWPDEEEVAKLAPILGLGNNVLGQGKSSSETKGWPKVKVGGNADEMPVGVSEVKKQQDEAMVIVDKDQQVELTQ